MAEVRFRKAGGGARRALGERPGSSASWVKRGLGQARSGSNAGWVKRGLGQECLGQARPGSNAFLAKSVLEQARLAQARLGQARPRSRAPCVKRLGEARLGQERPGLGTCPRQQML